MDFSDGDLEMFLYASQLLEENCRGSCIVSFLAIMAMRPQYSRLRLGICRPSTRNGYPAISQSLSVGCRVSSERSEDVRGELAPFEVATEEKAYSVSLILTSRTQSSNLS